MAQITSAIAAKQLRKLNDRRDALLAMEKKARAFTAAIQEDAESVRPAYDYKATQAALVEIEAKIRKLKHTLNCFNSTYVIPEFDMQVMCLTISQVDPGRYPLLLTVIGHGSGIREDFGFTEITP